MKFSKMLAAITQVLNQDSDTQVDVCMTSEMARRIELWTAMYEDNAPWVDRKKVKSAQLPAAIASEVARLVTLEMKSEITGGSSATYLNDQYQKKVLTSIRRYSIIAATRTVSRTRTHSGSVQASRSRNISTLPITVCHR